MPAPQRAQVDLLLDVKTVTAHPIATSDTTIAAGQPTKSSQPSPFHAHA